MLSLTLADWLKLQARGEVKSGKAKSVIHLWMGGGPPQTDTFDPKPEAGEAYCGPLRKPVDDQRAGHPDRRDAAVHGQAGRQVLDHPQHDAPQRRSRDGNLHHDDRHAADRRTRLSGSRRRGIAAARLPMGATRASLPPNIMLTYPVGPHLRGRLPGEQVPEHSITGGDPNAKEFRVQGLVPPGGLTGRRCNNGVPSSSRLMAWPATRRSEPALQNMDAFQERSYNLILGDAKKAFDLSQEDDKLRQKYGRNHFGQCCLVARRLVENDVPFITINMGGWDTHTDNFGAMKKLLPVLDAGFATLLEDLAAAGPAGEHDRRMVRRVWPNAESVRRSRRGSAAAIILGHVFSCVVAGGGFQGGKVVGASDAHGETVKERPVYPWDLSASMYQLLGIDPLGKLPHPQGCAAHVTPLGSGEMPSGGMLTEIM